MEAETQSRGAICLRYLAKKWQIRDLNTGLWTPISTPFQWCLNKCLLLPTLFLSANLALILGNEELFGEEEMCPSASWPQRMDHQFRPASLTWASRTASQWKLGADGDHRQPPGCEPVWRQRYKQGRRTKVVLEWGIDMINVMDNENSFTERQMSQQWAWYRNYKLSVVTQIGTEKNQLLDQCT